MTYEVSLAGIAEIRRLHKKGVIVREISAQLSIPIHVVKDVIENPPDVIELTEESYAASRDERLEQLLERAKGSGSKLTRNTAEMIGERVKWLRERLAREDRELELRAQVERYSALVETARKDLRELKGK